MWSIMKPLWLTLTLLLSSLSFCKAHTLSKIQNIPDAPALPRFNLDTLPDYIKAMFQESSKVKHNAKNLDWDDRLEFQVKDLEDSVNQEESDDVNDDYNKKQDSDDKKPARSYGMRISGDIGAVWNDVANVSHYVGKLDNVTSDVKPEKYNSTLTTPNTEYENDTIEEDRIDDNFGKELEEERVEVDSITEKENKRVDNAEESKENFDKRNEDEHPDQNIEEENIFDKPTDYMEEEIEAEVKNLLRIGNHPPINGIDKKREDLNSAHVSYEPDCDPEKVTNTPEPEHITQSTSLSDSNEDKEISVEQEHINSGDIIDNVVDDIQDNNKNSVEIDFDSNEIKDSFDEVKRIFEELIKNSSKPVTTHLILDKDCNEDKKKQLHENKNRNESNSQKPDHTKKEPTKDSSENIKPDKDSNKDTDKDKETVKHKDKVHNLTEIVKKLMNEIQSMIKKEVENQIKLYVKDHEDKISKDNEINIAKNITTDEAAPTSNGLNIFNGTTTDTAILDGKKDNNTGLSDTVADQLTSNVNATENDETVDKLKSKKNQNKDEKPVKIEAHNIYGSSVGNNKVTNIFIFNINNSSDLQQMKPISNGTDGVFVFGVDKKPDQDKNNDKTPVEQKEDTKPDENKKDQINETHSETDNNDKPEVNNNKPEQLEEQNKSKEDQNDKNSNNERTTKPSNESITTTTGKPNNVMEELETTTEVKDIETNKYANRTDETKGKSSSETKTESAKDTISTSERDAEPNIENKAEDKRANTNSASNENEESIDIDNINDKNTESTNEDTDGITIDDTNKINKPS